MASHRPAPAPDPKPASDAPASGNGGNGKGSATFMGFPVAHWAVVAISIIAIAYVAGHAYITLQGELEDQKTKVKQANDKVTALTAVNQDTSSYTNAVTKEKNFHETDQSGHRIVLHHDPAGDIVATYFDSDGCVAIARPGQEHTYSPYSNGPVDWVLGPNKKPLSTPPAVTATIRPQIPVSHEASHLALVSVIVPPPRLRVRQVQAGCLNPHPWTFRSWWGPANGCWAPQYRQWNDGCEHYQMYNACSGAWDQQIHWVRCVPNHHP